MMNRSQWSCTRRGFSLVEMVIVVVIITIMARLAMPRFSSVIARRRADAAAQQVLADLKWARSLARVTSVPVMVEFHKKENEEFYKFKDVPDPDRSDREYRVHLGKEPYMADIVTTSFGRDEVQFQIDGTCDNGSITLRVGLEQREIVTDPVSGRAVLQ